MESGEALRRIFWRYRWLLAALVLIPCVLVGGYRESQTPTFAAKADIQAQTSAPDASTQVLGILSRVTAVATSPQVVASAIKSAGVDRNAVQVAEHQITASSLNSSAVVELTVTDKDRSVAIKLCRALANEVTVQLNQLGSQTALQLSELTKQQSQLETRRNNLLNALSNASLSSTNASAQADITELNAVETQLANNLTAQQQAQASGFQGAAVISVPQVATGSSRHALVDAALAAILGLIVGLLIVAIREAIHPTLPDPAAGARELNVLHLGTVELSGPSSELDEGFLARLQLASDRRSVNTLVLTGPIGRPELTALAGNLDDRLRGTRSMARSAEASLPPGFAIAAPFSSQSNGKQTPRRSTGRTTKPPTENQELRVTAFSNVVPHLALPDPALVLVLPEFAPKSALEKVSELAMATGWPLLGIVGVRRKSERPLFPTTKEKATQADLPRPHQHQRQPIGSSKP
jgi:hypothetical protein